MRPVFPTEATAVMVELQADVSRPVRPCRQPFVLIGGMPRSGTTWLGKLFDSSPDTLYRHEPDSVAPPDLEPCPLEELDVQYRARLSDFVDRMLATCATRSTVRVPFFRKSYFSDAQWAVRVPMLHAYRVAARLVGELRVPEPAAIAGAARCVWKSVGKGALLLGHIARAMPCSRTILLVRHPGGFVASHLRGERRGAFTRGRQLHDQTWALERILETAVARDRGLTMAELRGAPPAERLAWIWVWKNDAMLAAVDGLSNAHVLRYEDLCARPVVVMRELFRFTGLSWSRQTEDFIGSSTRSDRDAFYSLTKDPARSALKWRRELTYDDGHRVLQVVRGTRSGALFELA